MGKTYSGGIKIATGFKREAKQPITDDMVVDTFTDLTTTEFGKYSYVGMQVYVTDEQDIYQLNAADSTINENWENITENENYFITDSTDISNLQNSANWDGDTYVGSAVTGYFYSDANYIYFRNPSGIIFRIKRYENAKLDTFREEVVVDIADQDTTITKTLTIPANARLKAWIYKVTDSFSNNFDADLTGGVVLNIATNASDNSGTTAKSFENEVNEGTITLEVSPNTASNFETTGQIKFQFYYETIPEIAS